MTKTKKMEKCELFFYRLAKELSKTHELVASCNKDFSAYLIPKGSVEDLTYYGKPANSFRISDHWNWYSPLSRCSDPTIVQCESVDMPIVNERVEPELWSQSWPGFQVAYYGEDGRYHHVYGDKFDRATGIWSWEERPVEEAAEMAR